MPRSSLPTCSQNSSMSGSTKLWAQTLDLAGHPFRQRGRADAMSDADVVPGVLFCNRGPLRLCFRLPVVYFRNAFCHLYRLEIANVISSMGRFPPISFLMSLGRWLLVLLLLLPVALIPIRAPLSSCHLKGLKQATWK